MKWTILALIFLISCAPITQDMTTKPVANSEVMQPAPQPVLQSQVKAPQETPPVQTTPEPTPVEEQKQELSPVEQCKEDCAENCKSTAQNACTQKGRPDCKAMCGDNPVVDPSACTQACTYVPNQASACKTMMEDFCSNQCVKACH